MKRSNFTLVLVFCISTILHAQNKPAGDVISGVVIDGEDSEPLVGVTVRVVGKSSGTVTDTNGRFQVVVDPHDLIRILYTGYETLELMPDEITQILNNVVPLQSGTVLQEVVITGRYPKGRGCRDTICRLFDNTVIPTTNQNDPALLTGDLTFSYFPNPTVEGVTVTSSLIEGEIEVVGLNGALVKTQRITDAYTQITMTDLPSGIYYLHYRYKVITAFIGQVVLARD